MSTKSKVLVVTILFITVFLSLYKLTESPPVWYDEGLYYQIAKNTAIFDIQGIQVAPKTFVSSAVISVGYPFIIPVSWFINIFGANIFGARLAMVVFILLTVGALFFLILKIFDQEVALYSLVLIMTFPMLYGNGKSVIGEVPGIFFLICFLITVYLIESRLYYGRILYLLAGMFAGLCLVTKSIFLILALAVIAAIITHRKTIEFNWKHLFIGFIAFLVPIIFWFKIQFWENDSIYSLLSFYANPYVVESIYSTITSNFISFFRELSPMYFMIIGIFWFAAYVIRISRKIPISLAESIAFYFSILIAITYLRSPGWYRYFFVAEVPMIAFLPNSIFVCVDYLSNKIGGIFSRKKIVAIIILFIFLFIQLYQLSFNSWIAEHYNSTKSQEIFLMIKYYLYMMLLILCLLFHQIIIINI